MPERAEWFHPVVSKYTNCKLPAFFKYAKDKENEQVSVRNESFVNKIYDKIPNRPINTRGMQLGTLEYTKLMNNINVRCAKDVSDLYDKLNTQYRYMINMKDEYVDNLRYVACQVREQFNSLGYSNEMITDMLVYYLYGGNKRYKQLLWFCYGQYIVNNLEKNIELKRTKLIQCEDCGEWIELTIESKSTRCNWCQTIHKRILDRERKRKK